MNVAVIFAGGFGSRMKNTGAPKQFMPFRGKPILIHTLDHFQNHPEIDAISLAILPEWLDDAREMIAHFGISKMRWIVGGGKTGQLSIYNALKAIESPNAENTNVLMHDGVRPLIDADLISRIIAQADRTGTAVTTYPTQETSVVSDDGSIICDVLDRPKTFIAQAPQAFRLSTILDCHERAIAEGKFDFIDSCSLFRAYEKDPVCMVEGLKCNIKITTPEDYHTLQVLYDTKEDK